MEQGAVFALVIAVVLVVLVVSYQLREQRRARWRAAAAARGLAYALRDPFGTLDLPFPLFRRGDGNGVENVIHGTIDGIPIRAFDFWYWETSTDAQGRSSRTTSRFCCAITRVPLRAPHTSIARETFLSRFADMIGFRDQGFESEEFNRAFQVRSTDDRFASYLIDARMMEWLMANGDGMEVELYDRDVLFVTARMNPEDIGALLDRATGFSAQIPRVARDTYPAAGA